MTAAENMGKALAAMVAAGVGSAAVGVLTTLAEVSPGLKNVLNFYDPVGPLSGKTTMAVIVWLIAWYMLARRWHARPPVMTSALVATFVLIGVGFVGTFPLFFELFTAPNKSLLRRSAAHWSEPPQRSQTLAEPWHAEDMMATGNEQRESLEYHGLTFVALGLREPLIR